MLFQKAKKFLANSIRRKQSIQDLLRLGTEEQIYKVN